MNSEVSSNLPEQSPDDFRTALSEIELYRHLFAWIGLVHTLQVSTAEECDTDLDQWRAVLLEAMKVAQSYRGTNLQLKAGFSDMLDSIPQLSAFYPELVNHLRTGDV
jgi:hypothetical protein